MGTRAAWLAWALAALSVAMFLASGVLHILARSAQSPFDLALFMADSSRRDGTGDAEQQPCGRDKGDDAACSRLALVAPGQASEGLAGGSLALYPAGCTPAPRRSPGAGHESSAMGAGLGEFVRRACTKVQAENRPPARCISPFSLL